MRAKSGSGLTTLAVGADKAEGVTTRFEAYSGNERDYDLANNALGREYAQQHPFAEPGLLDYCQSIGTAP